MSAPTVLIAAPASGSGKTTVTLAMLRALRRRGRAVGSFKVGPDYIDPGFHARASGRPCPNLDSWAMRLDTLTALLSEAARAADIVIGEGVMGLFDGAPGGPGSTADVAALFGLPVILVVDAQAMGASAAALVEGFLRHREDVDVAGVMFNRVAGPTHAAILREACDDRFSTPILGCLPRDQRLTLPSRHLGLVQAQEHASLESFLDDAASLVEAELNLDRLTRLARWPSISALPTEARPVPPLGQRIAVARDPAFSFVYEATLTGWRREGAEISLFSPLADEPPPPGSDAVFLPGGYPELHAGVIATRRRFIAGLRAGAARGTAIFGECGGYMVLGETLIDRAGDAHPMAGLLPVATSIAEPKRHLGYREVMLLDNGPLGPAGTRYRGHEFHYASELDRRAPPFIRSWDSRGSDLGESGCRVGTIAGSFLHLIDRTGRA
jgi:cobyrinic acid a,c-diamide synthase